MSGAPNARAVIAGVAASVLALGGLLTLAPPANADPVPVTITITTTAGEPSPGISAGSLFLVGEHTGSNSRNIEGDGTVTLDLEPDNYDAQVSMHVSRAGSGGTSIRMHHPFVVTGPGPVSINLVLYPMQVSITNPEGTYEGYGAYRLICSDRHFVVGENEDGSPYTSFTEDNLTNSIGVTSATEQSTAWGLALAQQDGDPPTCIVGAAFYGGTYQAYTFTRVNLDPGPNTITMTVPDPATVSGQVQLPAEFHSANFGSARLDVETQDGQPALNNTVRVDQTGHYSVKLAPGDYNFRLRENGVNSGVTLWTPVHVAGDTTLNLPLQVFPLDVHLANNTAGDDFYLHYSCTGPGASPRDRADDGDPSQVNGYVMADNSGGTVNIPQLGTGWSCSLELQTTDGSESFTTQVPSGPNAAHPDMTWYLDTGTTVGGVEGGNVDDDGVADTTESQGPNGGDGNQDGTSDYQQVNVTSLPANDGTPGPGETYVTVAGPAGSKLSGVSTMDPADAAIPPPDGATLPAGLISFTLNDVPLGSTQSVELWSNAYLGEATGWAKYDAVEHTWSTLPSDRVDVQWNHVTIQLTDGGIGDADGVENGTIVDPGGPSAPPPGDTTPPEVTGRATTRPNRAGWYSHNVRIHWTATDADSEVAHQPADTTVSAEGDYVTATSPEVCDTAPSPNCGTGELAGLKIDKSAPRVSIIGVTNGATYTVGNVPTPRCAASDALSGLASPCTGVRTGGNSAGVGSFTYLTSASDKAGNSRAVTAAYRVAYRFDGFLAPLNDPGPPVSVFKAGSTVPAAFLLKRANGQAITPANKPTWVTPVRGARTTLPVNEAVSTAKATSGSAFVFANNRWTHNWSTKGLASGYLYRIGVKLDDGTTHYLTIGVR